MQIQPTYNMNFGKISKSGGLFGRAKSTRVKNPYENKIKQLNKKYEHQIYQAYNFFKDKIVAKNELKKLKHLFEYKTDFIKTKKGLLGKEIFNI